MVALGVTNHGVTAVRRSDSPQAPGKSQSFAVTRARLTEFATIGLVSGSMLMHQILLTRVCALRFQFHFAFLVISNCLLGFGAAGTVLSIAQDRWRAQPARWVARSSVAYLISLIATYAFLIAIPLPENIKASRFDHVRGAPQSESLAALQSSIVV